MPGGREFFLDLIGFFMPHCRPFEHFQCQKFKSPTFARPPPPSGLTLIPALYEHAYLKHDGIFFISLLASED